MEAEATSSELDKVLKECRFLRKSTKRLELELEKVRDKYAKAIKKAAALREKKKQIENRNKINEVNSTLQEDWIEKEFPWSEEITELLTEKFGFEAFRPQQLAAINVTLTKRDVILLMPTGGGKSLVYQLPALLEPGFCLVISPLISLIEDQLHSLQKFEISAAAINSTTPKEETNRIYRDIKNPESELKLLYVTPEWVAKSKKFLSVIKKAHELKKITRVAIDEVHCCSLWGHDFRSDYDFLGILRVTLADVPFIGLTATATMAVLTDVQTMLGLENCMIITSPFNRPNLCYKVIPKPMTKAEAVCYVEDLIKYEFTNERGIIYTTTVNETVHLATDLKNRGIRAAPYHAQLDAKKRKSIHKKWIQKSYQVIVATVAFGMGIDQPDVRFVIHHAMPKSMESLYQESGRAGRDGQRSECILLFSLNDYFKVLGMATSVNDEKKATSVLEYCLDQFSCRRTLIANHFDDVWAENDCNKMCDHCDRIQNVQPFYYDITSACKDLYLIIDQATTNGEKLTVNKLLDGWLQTGSKKLRITTLKVPKITKRDAETIISYLVLKEFLGVEKGFNNYTTICYLVKGKPEIEEKIEMLSSAVYLGFPKRSSIEQEPTVKKSKV